MNSVSGVMYSFSFDFIFPVGSGNAMAVEEMLEYARDTQHEKIIRGLSLGVALIVYGREEEANHIIDDMLQDKDYLLRYGAMHAIAMAYVGTSNNSAIKRLLHVAVSDTSDDVRRAAVTALGFVLCNAPEQVPRIVSLLAESFNAHVRYGAALAVGIACAGSGSAAALSLLEPMLKDRVDYVRQAAFIAFGMVCIQSNEKKEPKVKVFKDLISSTLSKKGDTMTKLGAILGAGILDAGGRNVSIALLSPAGHKKMAAIVGMMLFPNFWYWFPMVHFLSLSFTPTAIIGLNHQMKMPKSFQFASGAPPSLFAYPAPMEIKKEEVKKKVKTATLSVTAKAKARAKKKTDTDGDTSMASNASDVDDDGEACAETESEVSSKEKESEDAEEKEEKAEKEEKEASFEVCDNPARVTWAQQSLLSFSQTQRFAPITSSLSPGFVMLRDTNTGSASASEEVEFVVFDPPKMRVHGVDDDEPEPPADFEFLG